jgi:plasmid stabilization system protein ParE
MKVVWTDEALRDLEEITAYVLVHFPSAAPALDQRIRAVLTWIGRWPESARLSAGRPGVRMVPLGRYPYRLFYRIGDNAVEVLHIHHAARKPWDEEAAET